MTERERSDFLGGVHLAVLAVARESGGPLVAPVWYQFDPTDGFRIATNNTSAKARLLRATGCGSVCVHQQGEPQRYVSAEGPITLQPLSELETREFMTEMAARYLGAQEAAEFMADFSEPDVVLVTLSPRRWRAEIL